jgi:hypothetical protein
MKPGMIKPATLPRTASLSHPAFVGLADPRARTPFEDLVSRESRKDRNGRVLIDACLRLARRRLSGIVFPRRTAVQERVLVHIIALLHPARRPELSVALRAVFGADGTVSFKAASRFIEDEWSIRMSDRTFADLWRRMVVALAPATARAMTAAVEPCRTRHASELREAELCFDTDSEVVNLACQASCDRVPLTSTHEGVTLVMMAVISAILEEESAADSAARAINLVRLQQAAGRLALDLVRP